MERPQPEHLPERTHSTKSSQSMSVSASVAGEEEAAACQSCRKRKLKCSREAPACSQCVRLTCPCNYDHKRMKPGIKTGAIETLSRRLEVLEKALLDSNGNQRAVPSPSDTQGCLYHASLLLARELQQGDDTEYLNGQATANQMSSRKRKRDWPDHDLLEQSWDTAKEEVLNSSLPSVGILKLIIDTYFTIIHPWIPFLHLRRFREHLDDPQKRPELDIILHALVYATMKYLKEEDVNMTQSEMERQVRLSRNVVMLTAMDNLTIENIQALIVVAFDDIGSGQVSKAWPIIGSLTRTVEYLQLTVEPDDTQQYSLLTPLSLLDKPSDWIESENRRRIFWNVFLLDRFCSVTTGWNTSLTSDDVLRRLPCDGGLWQHGEDAVVTPYFGIWNKSAAKIGNSIAYIPAHYPSPDHNVDSRSPNTGSSSGPVDTSKLGAFAYCIEATESLSQVTTFFLQQKVDFRNRQEAGSWLTRFKELDLRLVHWKMFLPQKWKDSNISRDTTFVNMDPNLTLAHITHNTSMILLHQHIAYPPHEWSELIRLPSSCSAWTCQSAAVETASISKKYLTYTKILILNSQFALCAFVAARILLVHWRYYTSELHPEFFSLVESLEDISARWRGHFPDDSDPSKLDIAGKYALHLRSLHQNCIASPQFRMDTNLGGLLPPLTIPMRSVSSPPVTIVSRDYAPDMQLQQDMNSEQEKQQPRPQMQTIHPPQFPPNSASFRHPSMQGLPPTATSQSPNTAFPPPPLASQQQPTNHNHDQYAPPYSSFPNPSLQSLNRQSLSQNLNGNLSPSDTGMVPLSQTRGSIASTGGVGGNEHNIDELTAMSNSLLGQQFLEMDRVITLDETDFALDLGMWSNS